MKIRYKTIPREGGFWSSNGRYVVITEQTILDLQEAVEKINISAKELVEFLKDSVEKESKED